MKTRFSTLALHNGALEERNTEEVDLHTVPSTDPLAYCFGRLQGRSGVPLPRKGSKEFRALAPEYVRGWHEGAGR